MMLGTIAAPLSRLEEGAIPGTPEWLPEGAVSHLDFINAQYYAGGATRLLSNLLGGGFDAGEIDGSGMLISPSNGNEPQYIGHMDNDFDNELATGLTIIFEVDSSTDPSGFLIYAGNGATFEVASNYILSNANGYLADIDEVSISDTITGSGIHRIGLTMNRDIGGGDYQYAWSHDGNAAQEQTVDYTPVVPTTILIGHDGVGTGNTLNTVYIRTITLYPAVDGTALAALTDIPTA